MNATTVKEGNKMKNTALTTGQQFHKRHVAAAIIFTINHIPHTDADTLQTLLELINIDGNFGNISDQELTHKMMLLARLMPNVCRESLITVAEILGVGLPLNARYGINLYSEERSPIC